MLKLLTCPRGHFWESAEEAPAEGVLACPQCGAPADTLASRSRITLRDPAQTWSRHESATV